ncbi:MAG TPA: phosphatidylglycerol lysyltransferase domain-containing protein [Polyangia bacterium]|nr:phosphatidylglycerol lysyltransferase domain-containing protein [Polyangia bacterium]
MPEAYSETARALAILRGHGWNATSFQILEPGFRYWFEPQVCVAYIDTGRAWVAAGAPIGPPHLVPAAAQRFAAAAAGNGRRACFFGTEDRFATTSPFAAMRIGEQPVWDPRAWDDTVRATASLRAQIRRAGAKGVEVRPFDPRLLADTNSQARRDVDRLIARWQAAHPMPPMGFLVQMHLDSALEERRLFAAHLGNSLVGFLSMVPVFARPGWFIEDLLRLPHAPNGTAELLVDAAMRAAAAAGTAYVTLGLAPLAGEVGPWLRIARRTGLPLYDFRGVQAFKAKLRPQSWAPIHISYPRGQSGIATVYDALAAFARGGLLRFGVETLLRRPGVLIQALALILVPWTILIAFAPAERWFPSPAVKWGWVAFDAALAPALSSLARRWRRGLDTTLATLVTTDAAATLFQLIAWNLRHGPRGALTWIVGAISVIAPTLVAALLWAGRRSGRANAA